MSGSTKALEPAFQGAGQKIGTEIWRIENFQPVPLPKSDFGKFYSGDSYIVLQGGVVSGFKKPEEEEFETTLYVCQGKRAVKVKQVPFARPSLNHDDVFVLDAEDKIYQFNGSNSNIQERAKALEVVQFLKDTYHEGTCDVAIVDDGKLQAESDSGEFWVLCGGFAPIGRKVNSEDDVVPEETPPRLYSISGGRVDSINGELTKGILENNKCYLLDCGAEIFVWFGRVAPVEERKAACQAVEEFVTGQNRPKATRITRIIQGYEPHSFKPHFASWPAGSATSGAEEGRGKVAAFLKQQGLGAKGVNKAAPVNEDVPPLLEGGGKTEVWRIDGKAKTPVPKDDVGKFYSGDCYIVLYTYHSGDKKEDYYLCWWIGKDSIKEDQQMAVQLANAMSNSLKGRPVLGRLYEGKEPPQFLAIIQPFLVLKGGLSSGYKKLLEEKELKDETYSTDALALVHVSGTARHNSKAVQVDAVPTSLNSFECFLLQPGSSIFTWHGNKSTHEQQQQATKFAEFLKPGAAVKHNKEGTESSTFWSALGGKQIYTSKKLNQEIFRDPHLFSISFNKGKFQVEEIYNFTQDDLLTEDILILDTHVEVFVWVGQSVDPREKQTAFEIGEKYVQMAASLESLSPKVPLYKTTEGYEPCFFTTCFSWDPAKATVQGNSFQKKLMLLFGASHAVESPNKSTGSNQGGPRQRAEALAALTSAFSPSSGEKSSGDGSYISDGSNQGGPRQRAEALAALSSAFNPSLDKKPAAPRPSVSGQGSQRAAALAALSSALTAEKKQKSPETSPVRSTRTFPTLADSSFPSPANSETLPQVSEELLKVSEVLERTSVEPAPESNGAASKSREDPEPKHEPEPEPEHEENGSESSQRTFRYEQLRAKSENPVTGIDFKRREAYLSDEEFQCVFNTSKEEFYRMPKWKQDMQKRKVHRF